jgi:hypothetical protein
VLLFMITGIVFQSEVPTDDGKAIPRDATKDTMPNTEDAKEGNTQADNQAKSIGADDNCEGDEV